MTLNLLLKIATNAPEGYIELMEECWNSDPKKRPTANIAFSKIQEMWRNEEINSNKNNPTKIIKSPDIGPVMNNPGANYKSRHLSKTIHSAMYLRSLRSSKQFTIDIED
jgi:hypothetical protein